MAQARICVVGAGVIGVSSAVRIQEIFPRAEVTLMSDKFSPNTTSDVSGGFWEPHLLGDTPVDNLRAWGQETLAYMTDLAFSAGAKEVGAVMASGYDVTDKSQDEFEDPVWSAIVYGYRRLDEREIKQFEGKKSGFFYTTAMVDVKLYLPWLMKRFRNKGGKIVERHLKSLQDLAVENFDVIVNCTGVGSSKLVNDKAVTPIRGHMIRVHAPWVKHFYIVSENGAEICFILPGARCIALGSTEQVGDWSTDVRKSDSKTIFDACCRFVPSLKNAEFDNDSVGLRPGRSAVRLERETIAAGGRQQHVVHNYGHGGSGVTLHWGCAGHAARLVAEIIGQEAFQARL